MVENSPSKKSSKSISDYVDLISKMLFGIFAILFSYLTWDYNTDTFCVGSVKTFVEMTKGTDLSGEAKDYNNPLMDKIVNKCAYSHEDLLNLIRINPQPIVSDKASVDTGSNSEEAGPQNWVAVGYLGGESNFTFKGSKNIQDLKAGDELTALTAVNVRRGVANWNTPLRQILKGENVVIVADPVDVQAGPERQVWARIK